MKRNNPAKWLRFVGNDSNDLRPGSRNRSFRLRERFLSLSLVLGSPTPEAQRPAAFCVSSPTRAALARARAQALVGEDQGGESGRPTRQEMSGAFYRKGPVASRRRRGSGASDRGHAPPCAGRCRGRRRLGSSRRKKLREGGVKPLKELARANLCACSRPIPDQGSRPVRPRPAPGRLRARGRPSRSARAP